MAEPESPGEKEANVLADRLFGPLPWFYRSHALARSNKAVSSVFSDILQKEILHGGVTLPEHLRVFFESTLKTDLTHVRLHLDGHVRFLTQYLSIAAFSIGTHIFMDAAVFQHDRRLALWLLTHEIIHTLQPAQKNLIQRSETVNWNVPMLIDCREDINERVNRVIQEAFRLYPKDREKAILYIYNELGASAAIAKAKIEVGLETLEPSKIWQPIQEDTKYAGVHSGSWSSVRKIFGALVDKVLGPTVNVNGIYIGTDKIGHFFAQGFDYFKRVHLQEMTLEEVQAWGRVTELTIYGVMTTGIYSKADLEANLRGYEFYKDLFFSNRLQMTSFDFAEYVDHSWNEVENPNLYSSEIGPLIWQNLLQGPWQGIMRKTQEQTQMIVHMQTDEDLHLKGSFEKNGTVGSIDGKISFIWQSMKSLDIEIMGFSSTKPQLIQGVKIDVTWQWNQEKGKGYWVSENEVTLKGSWENHKGEKGDWSIQRIPQFDAYTISLKDGAKKTSN